MANKIENQSTEGTKMSNKLFGKIKQKLCDFTSLDGRSERRHVMVKRISQVDQGETETSRFQLQSCRNAAKSSANDDDVDVVYWHLSAHLCREGQTNAHSASVEGHRGRGLTQVYSFQKISNNYSPLILQQRMKGFMLARGYGWRSRWETGWRRKSCVRAAN